MKLAINMVSVRKSVLKQDEEKDTAIRINVRISSENLEYMREEAKTTGTNVSALCSIAIAEWIRGRRYQGSIEHEYDMAKQKREIETMKKMIDQLAEELRAKK